MSGLMDEAIDRIKGLKKRLRSLDNKIDNRQRQITALGEGLVPLLAERDRDE